MGVCSTLAAIWFLIGAAGGAAERSGGCNRTVVLAPSLVEIVYELGLGAGVVGVTEYALYPPEAQRRPRMGGLFDPNLEQIVSLRPDRVFALTEFGERLAVLSAAGVAVSLHDHRTVGGIQASIRSIAAECGVPERGVELVEELERKTAAIRARIPAGPRPRTMVVVGGGHEDGVLRSVFISGRDSFYEELLEWAGGRNVLERNTVSMPSLSAEGLLALNPEVIIEVRAEGNGAAPLDRARLLRSWQQVRNLSAVRSGRIYVLEDDFMTIPGPRYPAALERIARVLYPEVW